jgi:tetratricopeptide (TPR) repeat protein
LRDRSHLDLAIQLLEDFSTITDIHPLLKAQLRDNLRSLHYGIAQGYFSPWQKPSLSTRIRHMQAIIELGFELGYVYKFLAEAFHELGDDETARSHLRRAIEIDPQVSGVKTIMRVLGM